MLLISLLLRYNKIVKGMIVKVKEKLLDPKVDFVFKRIFGSEKHPNILIAFLNSVLGTKGTTK